MHPIIHHVPPGSSLIPPQMAHVDVEMMFMVLLGVMTQKAGIYTMTYNESTGPVVGSCFYNLPPPTLTHTLYDLVPSNITELNNYMCGHLNREGQLCGRCKENYSVPVYSYDLKCVQCSTSPFNWVKYILAAFLPLTVFFVVVVSCRLSATSPKLLTFVSLVSLFQQGLTCVLC